MSLKVTYRNYRNALRLHVWKQTEYGKNVLLNLTVTDTEIKLFVPKEHVWKLKVKKETTKL